MENSVSILEPVKQADENMELLVELLKAERKADKARIAEQRKKIVELTASRNELLAQQNGVSESEVEQLREHVRDMEENAKKMADTLHHRVKDIESVTKALESTKSIIIKNQQEIDLKDVAIKAYKKRIEELEKQIGDKDKGMSLGDIFESMYHDAKELGIDVDGNEND